MALVGSDLDRKIKEAASKGEPQWDGIGETVRLRVWRIEKFRVVPWPNSKYGKFHTGDSYVILNSYKPDPSKPKLCHDLHIWIGDESSQDEYGTAAYKMVEADDNLGGAAVQHREVQYQESDKFTSYFKKKLIYLEGGIESGFRHVEATEDDPHLYRVKGLKKALCLTQVPVRRDSMNGGDVFILHAAANKVWTWNGKESNADEKQKGMEVARGFASNANVIVLDQGVNDSETEAAEFWKYMPSSVSTLKIFKRNVSVKASDGDDGKVKAFTPILYRLPDSDNGRMKRVARSKPVVVGVGAAVERIKRTELKEEHGYLLDTGFHVYIWLGKDTKSAMRVNALSQSNVHFKKHKRPMLPVTIVKSNQSLSTFDNFFYDPPQNKSVCQCIIL